MKLLVKTSKKQYPIYIENKALQHINDYFDTNRNVFIITDKGVPTDYVSMVKNQCQGNSYVYTAQSGEQAKSFAIYEAIMTQMLSCQINRHDVVVAIGGGVIGDLAGFVSATYMRGISFINIPTTTLSQIDSSIGGKVAINLGNTKNIVGAFNPPDCVIIDPDTLRSLPKRHFNNGLVEAMKAGLLQNPQLFECFERNDVPSQINQIIYESLLIKKAIVEADEFERHERKLLNFGHTLGHALESYYELSELLHGESVAIGMLAMIDNEHLRSRLQHVLNNMNMKTSVLFDKDKLHEYITKDKKVMGSDISVVVLHDISKPEILSIPLHNIDSYIKRLAELQ